MPDRLYLGVDGGQSSSTALIADETGTVIGRGRGGPCNHISGAEAVEKFNRVIAGTLAEACGHAGLDAETIRFRAACLGFSGGPEDKRSLSEALIRSERYQITHDAAIALTGATAGEPGIIVIAGTGSMAFGLNADGKSARAGGWGYIYGDEGGAFDIVRRALRAVLKAEEGWGSATSLLARLLQSTGEPSADALLHSFYTPEYHRSKVAALAPLVDEEARAGDEVAAQILVAAAARLAVLVRGVYAQLFSAAAAVLVAPVGGAFASEFLRTAFAAHIRADTCCIVSEPKWNPAAGALLQALRSDGNQSLPHGTELAGK